MYLAPKYNITMGAVVVVQWSALLPTAPKIRVRIPLATKFFSNCTVRKGKNKRKEAGNGPLKKIKEKEAGIGPLKKIKEKEAGIGPLKNRNLHGKTADLVPEL